MLADKEALLLKSVIALAILVLFLFVIKANLSACYVSLFSFNCYNEDKAEIEREVSKIRFEIDVLKDKVSKAQINLAKRTCESTVKKIDEEKWSSGETKMLKGCWALDSDYELVEEGTNKVFKVKDWTMCFDENGISNDNKILGIQNLIYETGQKCVNQPVIGEFKLENKISKLLLDDTKLVQCEGTGGIYRRQLKCSLDKSGFQASCNDRYFKKGKWSTWSSGKIRLRLR